MFLSFFISCNAWAWAWPWDNKNQTKENATPTVSPADIASDEAQEKKWERIVPEFAVTRKAEKKFASYEKDSSEQYNLEKSKYGEPSRETSFYYGWVHAVYTNNIFVNQKSFKQKYFKVKNLWERYEKYCEKNKRSPEAMDTEYDRNLYKLKYAYENFVATVAEFDESVRDFGLGETLSDSNLLEHESRDVEVYKEVDSELDDWLSRQRN